MKKYHVNIMINRDLKERERFNIDVFLEIPIVGLVHKRLEHSPMTYDTAYFTAQAIARTFSEPAQIGLGIEE